MPGTRYPGALYPGQYAGSVDAAVAVTGVSCTSVIGSVVASAQYGVPIAYLPFAIRPAQAPRYHCDATVAVAGLDAMGAIGQVVATGTIRRRRRVATRPTRRPVAVPTVVLQDEAVYFAGEAARLVMLRRDDEEWLLITAA